MPADVKAELESIAETQGMLAKTDAAQFVLQLEQSRRLQLETWS